MFAVIIMKILQFHKKINIAIDKLYKTLAIFTTNLKNINQKFLKLPT